jgi:hypothetical protein
MQSVIEQIEALDIDLFKAIPSQTTDNEKRSLLAVQRATAKKYGSYAYLEIGSHLGGSIQPYLVDHRCATIYSIDARPQQQPDDRGVVCNYPGNSTARMLTLLGQIDPLQVCKIKCFDTDASDVSADRITTAPQICFIDGEHTKRATLSDFRFCSTVAAADGVILFHDFQVIYPAIYKMHRLLKRQRRSFVALKLDDSLFGFFFDHALVQSDSYLAAACVRNRHFLRYWPVQAGRKRAGVWLRRVLPAPARKALKYCWNSVAH